FPLVSQHQHPGLSRLLGYTSIVVSTLSDVSDLFDVPAFHTIAGPTLMVLETAQSVKIHKEQCGVMLERLHMLLCILVQLCVGTKGELNPDILDRISILAETIQKVQVCLSQQQGGRIRRFLRKDEASIQIQDCIFRFDGAIEDFRIITTSMVGNMVTEMQADIVARQNQIIELIQDSADSETASSFRGRSYFSGSSSGAISLLPGSPKIFHGRETALESLVSMLLSTPARVAILGAGGIGKTSLSIALLWDPRIIGVFPDRYFVSCESMHTVQDMLVTLATYLDIAPSNHLMRSILRYFSDRGPTMIVLDNLETAWESVEDSRRGIEEFLGQLTEIHHVALVVTMRGVERPGGVRWTRPFLPALDPVDSTAAREIYVDIADEPVDEDEDAQVQELLSLTDNLPLAITLLANIASFEGVSATLNRYRLETTAMLSEGYDKRSNLHKSIMLSLGSWRLRAVPDATTLLAVLSLLPDGVSPSQLYRCGTDIEEIGRCKSTLIRTSLAFLRPDGRLSVLTPIREYMQKFHPASRDTVKPWKAYLGDLLLDWASQRDLVSTQLADSITDNLGNIRSLVHYSFSDDDTTM
ncbi:hypothetical protein DFH09DRAFT_1427715, partial [Mycena vulgaris]